MTNKLKVIFCGVVGPGKNVSWGNTNSIFIEYLNKEADIIGIIDYEVGNKFLKKIHTVFSKIMYGGSAIRDPILDHFMERSFIRQMKKIKTPPDLMIHSSSVCVPESLKDLCPHLLYTDATIMAEIKYNNFKASERALKVLYEESEKYMKRLNKVFTFNEWTKDSLINDYNVDAEKIEAIGFGANLDPYRGDKNYEEPLILTVLRKGKEKEKGFYLLLEGFKQAKKTNSKLKLAVVGTNGENVEGVTYYENFPRTKTVELFHEASLFAMPAVFEPNGMVYIEALACKTPILGLNRLAFPEFCGYGQYGFMAEENSQSVSEQILKAFEDTGRLKKMGMEGQEYVLERYDWRVVIKKILNAYENN